METWRQIIYKRERERKRNENVTGSKIYLINTLQKCKLLTHKTWFELLSAHRITGSLDSSAPGSNGLIPVSPFVLLPDEGDDDDDDAQFFSTSKQNKNSCRVRLHLHYSSALSGSRCSYFTCTTVCHLLASNSLI